MILENVNNNVCELVATSFLVAAKLAFYKPILACCGGLVESGLQERYGLIEIEEGVTGKGVQVLGGKWEVLPRSNCRYEELQSNCDREHSRVLELEAEIAEKQQMLAKSENQNSLIQKHQFVDRSMKSVHTKPHQAKHVVNTSTNAWNATKNTVTRIVPIWKPTGRRFNLHDIFGSRMSTEPIVKPLKLTPCVSSSTKIPMLSKFVAVALGMESWFQRNPCYISQNPKGIFIFQAKYALEILKKHGFDTSTPIDTSMSERPDLDEDIGGKIVDPIRYRGLAKPTEKHLHAIKRIFRYLKGTLNMGLWYPKNSNFTLTAFVDADYERCQDTRRSTSGSAQFLQGRLDVARRSYGCVHSFLIMVLYSMPFNESDLVEREMMLYCNTGHKLSAPSEDPKWLLDKDIHS
nr:hypothetical protein [Tanacetum cinerariifolium]